VVPLTTIGLDISRVFTMFQINKPQIRELRVLEIAQHSAKTVKIGAS